MTEVKEIVADFRQWLEDYYQIKIPKELADQYEKDRIKNLLNKITPQSIVEAFSRVTGKKTKLTKSRSTTIIARIKDGNKYQQFLAVFRFKYNEWKDDPEMKKHIIIETMLRPSHFQKYLEQAREDFVKKHGKANWFMATLDKVPFDDFNV